MFWNQGKEGVTIRRNACQVCYSDACAQIQKEQKNGTTVYASKKLLDAFLIHA